MDYTTGASELSGRGEWDYLLTKRHSASPKTVRVVGVVVLEVGSEQVCFWDPVMTMVDWVLKNMYYIYSYRPHHNLCG